MLRVSAATPAARFPWRLTCPGVAAVRARRRPRRGRRFSRIATLRVATRGRFRVVLRIVLRDMPRLVFRVVSPARVDAADT